MDYIDTPMWPDEGCRITHFSIDNNEIYVNDHHHGAGGVKTINDWGKFTQPKPLFVTEDGVELFDRHHEVYAIEKGKYELFKQHNGKAISIWLNGWYTTQQIPNPKEHDDEVLKLIKKNFLLFAARDKAEEYILMNKPVLSVNDVEKIGVFMYNHESYEQIINFNQLKKIAKEKIDAKV